MRVPHLLTREQKRTRFTLSKGNLELFEADEDNFLVRFITMAESWDHHFQPESKEQSKKWKRTSSATPEEGQGRSFSWQGHGLCFLGFPVYHTDRIPSEVPHSDWKALF